jgi:hypothetical protein
MRERAETMVTSDEKYAALAKADQADKAAEMDQWIRSSELTPPK